MLQYIIPIEYLFITKCQHTLSFWLPGLWASFTVYAIKQSSAPIHNSAEKPPNICFINFIISGVCLGGVIAFGPSLCKTNSAWASEKPWINDNLKQWLITYLLPFGGQLLDVDKVPQLVAYAHPFE